MTTVVNDMIAKSVRDVVLIDVIKDTIARGIKPQQCSMYSKFSLYNGILYEVTVFSTGQVTVRNTKNNREQPALIFSITDELEETLLELLVEGYCEQK